MTLLIAVLSNKFLDKPYKKILRIGFGIILGRFFASVCLLSFFQTRMLTFIPYLCFCLIDYIMYLYFARAFHQLLCNRRNEARIDSREEPRLYRERSHVLLQYRVTTLYTISLVSLYLLITFLNKISTFIYLLGVDSCYISFITYGYIPTFQLSIDAQTMVTVVVFGISCVSVLALYIFELLVFVAYLAVCVSIVVKYFTYLRRQKRTPNQVARFVDEYHRDFPAYSD